jgi:threonine-phosphate decarboxylase
LTIHQHGGNVFFYSRYFNFPISDILDYSANINPLGFPRVIRNAIIDNFDMLLHYPDPEYKELKNAIAGFINAQVENIILGNGAVELIYLLCNMLQPKRVSIVVPTFSEYERAATKRGTSINHLTLTEEDNFSLPVENILAALPDSQVLFICNPNNPTGNLFPRDQLEFIAAKCCKHGVLLVVDESFIEFTLANKDHSLINLVHSKKIFVISSLTKILGIPGLRIGYGIGDPQLIDKLSLKKDPWNINCFAEFAVKAGLSDQFFFENTRRLVSLEKDFVYQKLASLSGIKPFPSEVNFLLAKITKSNLTSTQLAEKMAAKQILIRDCSNFSGLSDKYIRLGIKNREMNLTMLERLTSVLLGDDER